MEKQDAGCVICATPISPENDSTEHVIPQAIGGRWTVRGFICRRCNSRAGKCWDSVLTKQLEWPSSILGVQRERGSAPPVPVSTVGGTSLHLRADGGYQPRRPEVKEIFDGTTFNVSISGRSLREIRQQAHALKKKYPDAKVEEALAGVRKTRDYLKEAVHVQFQLGGNEANASMVKTALAAAFSCGFPLSACDLALTYLRTLQGPPPIHFFLDRDLVRERPADRFLHILGIRADPAQNLALAYIDYFGLWRSVVVMSMTYEGPAVAHTYAFDPIGAEPFFLEVDLSLSDEEIRGVLEGDEFPNESWISIYSALLPRVLARAEQRHLHRVIEEAFDEAEAILGFEGELGPDQQDAYIGLASRLVAERVVEIIRAKAKIRGIRGDSTLGKPHDPSR
ncbi:HNH endonuclease [Luteibacter jiangsuensis]